MDRKCVNEGPDMKNVFIVMTLIDLNTLHVPGGTVGLSLRFVV